MREGENKSRGDEASRDMTLLIKHSFLTPHYSEWYENLLTNAEISNISQEHKRGNNATNVYV